MSNKIGVVKILVQNDEEEFLVVKERENGQWELPGGKIEEKLGESRKEAGKRELKEEVNLETENLFDIVRVEVEEFKEKKTVNCWIMFAEQFSGEIELYEEELTDWEWVSAGEFREMDWHADAGYAIPAMRFLDYYR